MRESALTPRAAETFNMAFMKSLFMLRAEAFPPVLSTGRWHVWQISLSSGSGVLLKNSESGAEFPSFSRRI